MATEINYNKFAATLVGGPCDGKLIPSNEFGIVPIEITEPCAWRKNEMHVYELCFPSWAAWLAGMIKAPHYHYRGLERVSGVKS